MIHRFSADAIESIAWSLNIEDMPQRERAWPSLTAYSRSRRTHFTKADPGLHSAGSGISGVFSASNLNIQAFVLPLASSNVLSLPRIFIGLRDIEAADAPSPRLPIATPFFYNPRECFFLASDCHHKIIFRIGLALRPCFTKHQFHAAMIIWSRKKRRPIR